MKEINENGGGADENMWEERGIYFSKIAGKKAILSGSELWALLPSLGVQVHTFAISSDFLNSPLTSVTSPFSLTSVQRNFSSLEGFPTLLRPRIEPLASFRKLGSNGRSSGLSADSPGFFVGGQHHCRNDLEHLGT